MRFARRELIGSDLVIVLAMVLHLSEALVFLLTRSADGSIGMAALLSVFRGPQLAAGVLIIAAIAAGFGQWLYGLRPDVRISLLAPQLTLFLITAIGAIWAILHGSYADGVARPWLFITCDQVHRIGAPMIYIAAIVARAQSHA